MADVLIVDDESAVREILRRWLRAAGHTIREAGNSQEALDTMATQPAGVVFCDVQMPGPDGLWLTGELRRRFPVSAIVLATGVSSVPAKISMQCGVIAYLLKPFNRGAVLGATAMAVAWHEETAARGPKVEDTEARLAEWLRSIDAAMGI